MAPENAPSLVIFDSSRFEDSKLIGSISYIEVPDGERIRVRWGVEKKPEGFRSVGGGVAFVRERDALDIVPISDDASPTHLGDFRYQFSEGLNQGIPWVMYILILPEHYTLIEPRPEPSLVNAKIFGKRLACYWILEGDKLDRTRFECTIGKIKGSLASELEKINSQYISVNLPDSSSVVKVVDDDENLNLRINTSHVKQVFISYDRVDTRFAHRLAEDLKGLGVKVWIAPESILAGEGWVDAINRGLEESSHVVTVLTPSALESQWVRIETNTAIARERRGQLKLIPLDVEPCNPPPLWTNYQMIHFLDQYEEGFKQLSSTLELGTMTENTDLSPEPKPKAKGAGKRFRVALSFPGERRKFVGKVAESLIEEFGEEQVFYDKNFEAELARPDLDTYLQGIYHNDSELIVVFLCAEYEKKEWCGLEWRAIRDLIKKKKAWEIMFVRFDDTEIAGTFSIDGYVSAEGREPEEVAERIIERYRINEQRLRDEKRGRR